jgi:lipopolysaccharide/colanic/teichoic acid biosynthesis glycosyltransferase
LPGHVPTGAWELKMKRCFDIVFALVAGLLSLPIMLVVGIAVAIWLGRPVLFYQTRAGLDRRPFRMMKFRSMSDARDAEGRPLSDAERTGRFGLLLRRTRLDELPEFWNILIGDMSLIGLRSAATPFFRTTTSSILISGTLPTDQPGSISRSSPKLFW